MIDGPNMYAYVGGNTIKLFDPLGLCCEAERLEMEAMCDRFTIAAAACLVAAGICALCIAGCMLVPAGRILCLVTCKNSCAAAAAACIAADHLQKDCRAKTIRYNDCLENIEHPECCSE